VDKNSTEQSAAQCQHPAEGTHIHVVEQVRPQGMKKTMDKTMKYVTTTKTAEKLYPQYCATIQTAIPVEKHNYPYQIGKTDVPQHQPQYDNRTHS